MLIQKKVQQMVLVVVTLLLANTALAKRLMPVEVDLTSMAGGLEVFVKDDRGAPVRSQLWIETRDGRVLAELTATVGHAVAAISDADLSQGVSITAYAPGYSVLSMTENTAHRVSLELLQLRSDDYAILGGLMNGFDSNDDSGRAVLGVAGKAFVVDDLVELDLGSFISPLKDTIDVMGERQIPSNIALPDQSVSYILFPVHLNKPTYRLPMLMGTSSRYFAMSGTVSVSDAISALKSNKPWDLINAITFSKAGVTAPILAGPGSNVRFDLSSDLPLTEDFHLKPGRNLSQNSSKRLAISVLQPVAGVFVPTDLKLVGSGVLALKSAVSAGSSAVLDVLIGNDGAHFRGAWVAADARTLPDVGLSATLSGATTDGDWVIGGAENSQLFSAHLEALKTTRVGSNVYEDRWTVLGPSRGRFRLPVAAAKALLARIGTISHVSVDLLQTVSGSYPVMSGSQFKGAEFAGELKAFEKVRKKL